MTDEQRQFVKQGATLCLFTSKDQMALITDGALGEESKFFIDKVDEYVKRIESMPKTYDQDGMGDEAIAHLHYFVAGCDWYITEKDKGDGTEKGIPPQIQAFGICRLNPADEFELGYINIEEVVGAGAELDLHFTPTTLAELRRKHEDTPPHGPVKVFVMTRDGEDEQQPQPLDAATLEQIAAAFSNERNQ